MPIVVHQVVLERAARSWSLPKVVIQMWRCGNRITLANRPPGIVIPASSEGGFPNDAGVKSRHGLLNGWPTPPLVAHLNHATVFPGRLHHPDAFLRVMAARFFHIHMFPCRAGQDARRGMPVVAGRDHHCIQLLVIKHAPEISNPFGLLGLAFGSCLNGLTGPLLIHIANVGKFYVGKG